VSKLLSHGGCPPQALGGLAVYRPERAGPETREMVQVLDKDGSVVATLALGHGLLKEYEERGYAMRVVQVKTDVRGRMTR